MLFQWKNAKSRFKVVIWSLAIWKLVIAFHHFFTFGGWLSVTKSWRDVMKIAMLSSHVIPLHTSDVAHNWSPFRQQKPLDLRIPDILSLLAALSEEKTCRQYRYGILPGIHPPTSPTIPSTWALRAAATAGPLPCKTLAANSCANASPRRPWHKESLPRPGSSYQTGKGCLCTCHIG